MPVGAVGSIHISLYGANVYCHVALGSSGWSGPKVLTSLPSLKNPNAGWLGGPHLPGVALSCVFTRWQRPFRSFAPPLRPL